MNAKTKVIVVCGLAVASVIVFRWRGTEALPEKAENVVEASERESSRTTESVPAVQDEHRELLRLRNEVRQLREGVTQTNLEAAARKDVAADAPAEVQPSPPHTPRTALTPEWKGMESHATNTYARALERLGTANSEMDRFFALGDAAKLSFAFGQTEHAQAFAAELLALGEKFKGEPWSNGCGDATYAGNLVLGRLALEQGAIDEAKRYLLESSTSTGSPVLGSFGPNMSLARELLERGERETVLEYFQRCGNFWKSEKLQQWTDEVNAGRIPDFGPNLIF